MTYTTLFKSNRSQAMRLPRDVAFPDSVRDVSIRRDGERRIIAPADRSWDDFFALSGVDVGERSQPAVQEREDL